MKIPVRFLLLATAALALREAGEAGEDTANAAAVVALREAGEEGENSANSIGQRTSEGKSKTNDAVALLKKKEFGDSKAFTMLMNIEIPPDNLEAFNELAKETSEAYNNASKGIFLFHTFTNEARPNELAVAQVFSDPDAFVQHLKTPPYEKWEKGLKDLGAEIVRTKFLGDPEFSAERQQTIAEGKAEYWQQTVGFARLPHHNKVSGETFLIESTFNVPNDNLPTINTINTAFIATQFDWDPTCFFARVCLDPNHDGEDTKFSFGGIYLMGRRPWSRAVELGEGKTEQNWLMTAAQYGVQLQEQHIYGNVSPKFKDLMKKMSTANTTTFWDFAYGYDRYKSDRYMDD